MSGASRDVEMMAGEAEKVELEADHQEHVEHETSGGPHQTLAPALDVPEHVQHETSGGPHQTLAPALDVPEHETSGGPHQTLAPALDVPEHVEHETSGGPHQTLPPALDVLEHVEHETSDSPHQTLAPALDVPEHVEHETSGGPHQTLAPALDVLEHEPSGGPHQTLAPALDVPEVQASSGGSQSSDKGYPQGTGHDPIDDPHQCLLKEGADDRNRSDGSQEDGPHGTADETQLVSRLLEENHLESRGLIEEPEISNVGLREDQEVTTAEDVGGLDTSECLQDCVSAAVDRDGETGGLRNDGSHSPRSVHEETSHQESEDTEQVQKTPEHKNIETPASETKLEEAMDTDPEPPVASGVEHEEHKDLKDDASDTALEDSGDFTGISSVVGAVASNVSPPVTPIQREEDVTAESLHTKRKHVFVLSEAGKPIYSRYGNEEALSSNMGVMMALVSFVQSGNNIIRSIHSEKQKVVFLQQGPLVLVSVSRAPQSEEQLRMELQYVYYQIISMLTQASVARIFERKKNYDLRRLLAGSEKILDSLLDLLDTDAGYLLGAVRCVALPSPLRDSLSSILTKAITPNLVFSILVAEQQLVTVVQERAVIEDCRLDPADLHLLLNLIGASSAFQTGEIWTPICLPRFNPDGYFYAYISYLDPDCTVCLVLLSTDKESFYAVSDCKKRIQEAMEAQNSLQVLAGALRCCSYSVSLVGVPELLHFVYKPLDIPDPYRQLPQFTSPEPDGPYANEEEKQRLFDLYRYLHCRIHSSARPLRLIYHVAEKETLLAWVTSKFELYTSFSSLVTKVGAINVITKLLRWIKREEDRLFIRYPPKYSTTPVPGKGAKSSRTDRTDPSPNGFFTGL